MRIKRLHPDFTIATQISEEKIPKVAGEGFRSIICNRPNGESGDQTDFETVKAAAEKLGMETCYIPISLDGASPGDQQKFETAVAELPKPILAYCRSGIRCANLWNTYQNSTRNL